MSDFDYSLPCHLYRSEAVQELDKQAIASGVPGIILMQRAGQAIFDLVTQYYANASEIIVFSGTGNNGGDGLIAGLLAHQAGYSTRIFLLGKPEQLSGEAHEAYQLLQQSNIQVLPFDEKAKFSPDAVIIDALLGTGISGKLRNNYIEAIAQINASHNPVIAVDLPSGLDPNTGTVNELAVNAHHTLSFIGLKQGLLTHDGPDYSGILHFDDLNIPSAIYEKVKPNATRLEWSAFKSIFKKRKRNSHKKAYGHILIIGGNKGMSGAVVMSGLAALRAGAGLVSIATLDEHASIIDSQYPELMCYGVNDIATLKPLIDTVDVIAIGPGLGQSAWSKALLQASLHAPQPKIIDADALNLLAELSVKQNNWILTPHPGEAARLLNVQPSQVQSDRFMACRQLQEQYGGCVVLKGNGTIIIDENQSFSLCSFGNPGMSSAGMGDILTGIIASLIAQKFPLAIAAQAGTLLHALAGDMAATESGERGMIATDLLKHIQKMVNPI